NQIVPSIRLKPNRSISGYGLRIRRVGAMVENGPDQARNHALPVEVPDGEDAPGAAESLAQAAVFSESRESLGQSGGVRRRDDDGGAALSEELRSRRVEPDRSGDRPAARQIACDLGREVCVGGDGSLGDHEDVRRSKQAGVLVARYDALEDVGGLGESRELV